MALVMQCDRTDIRLTNDHLAEAHRRALAAGDNWLASRIEKLWQAAERRCAEEEERQVTTAA